MKDKIKITIEDLGYNAFFESNRKKLGLDAFSVARITSEHKESYRVKNENGEYLAKITGKQMFNASSREDYPAVGDWVAITELGDERAVIHTILPRKTIIKRKYSSKNETQVIATNIDVAFVVESVDRDYNLNRFERYFAIARDGRITPAIILNKVDLISKEELDSKLTEIRKRFPNVDFVPTSTLNDKGLDELRKYIATNQDLLFSWFVRSREVLLDQQATRQGYYKNGDHQLLLGQRETHDYEKRDVLLKKHRHRDRQSRNAGGGNDGRECGYRQAVRCDNRPGQEV